MPRPCTFPVEELRSLIATEINSIFLSDGKIAGKSSEVWQRLSEGMKSHTVSKLHCYTILLENRYGLRDYFQSSSDRSLTAAINTDELNGSFNTLDTSANSLDITTKTLNTSTDTSSYSIDNDEYAEQKHETIPKNYEERKFTVTFSQKEWNDISPETVIYKDNRRKCLRTYDVLKRGKWTHVMATQFWKHTKLPCKIIFKGGKISLPAEAKYLSISGTCTFCKARFLACVDRKPQTSGDVRMHCQYKGSFTISHPATSKRNLSGAVRKRAVKKMIHENMSASVLQKLDANELMEFGDPTPSHVPSINVLRVAKCEALKKTRLHADPIVAIAKAMYIAPYQGVIRDLAYDKFHVWYHSTAQLHVYRNYCENNPSHSLMIDATGGVVKKLERSAGTKSGNIFLYSAVVRDSDLQKIYPVCSMLSERHDTESIRHWLSMWQRDGAPTPLEVVVDMSQALMSACIQAFTAFPSLNAYLEECSKILRPNDCPKLNLPTCFLRNDVAHVVKLMTTWPSLRGQLRRTRQFYLRTLCLVIQSEDVDDCIRILTDIITVASNDTEGDDESTGLPTPCEISKNSLLKRIGGINFKDGDDITEDENQIIEPSVIDIPNKRSPFTVRVQQIVRDVRSIDSTRMRGNQQALPNLVDDILKIAHLIPIFTAIMVPHYGYGKSTATSSSVESYFNDLKNRVFRHTVLPLRVDDFILNHIKSIEGSMKLAAADFVQQKPDSSPRDICEPETVICDNDNTKSTIEISPSPPHEADDKVDDPAHLSACEESVAITASVNSVAVLSEVAQDQVDPLYHRTTDMSEIENWRGLEEEKVKRKRKSYLQPCSEWLRVDLSQVKPIIPVGLMKNGNDRTLQPIVVNGRKIILSNTCAFDSLMQILCSAYCDSDAYKEYVDGAANFDLGKLAADIVKNGISAVSYKRRAEILSPHYRSTKLPSQIFHMKCQTQISTLISQITKGHWSTLEENECSNLQCTEAIREFQRPLLTVTLNDLSIGDLGRLVSEDIADKCTSCAIRINKNRSHCDGFRTRKTTILGKHMFVEILTRDKKQHNLLIECLLRLSEIPQQIGIRDTVFHLRGVVEFIRGDESADDSNIRRDKALGPLGHYIGLCRRHDDTWERYNDLETKKSECNRKQEVLSHVIMYTI